MDIRLILDNCVIQAKRSSWHLQLGIDGRHQVISKIFEVEASLPCH